MADSEAELTLVLTAKDLASRTVDAFKGSIDSVGRTASAAAGKVASAFRALSSGITNGLGNLTENLAAGAGLGPSLLTFGAYMAGQAAESFIGTMLEKMASSSLVAAIGGPISAAGSALGGVISAAIPIGMALLPVLVLGAIVAAIVFLINNPQIVNKVIEVAHGVIKFLVNGLATLAGKLLGVFAAAFQGVVDATSGFVSAVVRFWLGIPGALIGLGASIVTTIVNGLASFPGKLWDIVTRAFKGLKIDVGPFHIRSTGVTIDLPRIKSGQEASDAILTIAQQYRGHAAGGWVGLQGPELAWLGEKGPEYVTPNNRLGSTGGSPVSIPIVIDGREIARVVDEHLYYDARRAAPTASRT